MRSSWNGLYILDMFMSIQDVQFLAFNTENVACFALKCIPQSLSHFSRFLGLVIVLCGYELMLKNNGCIAVLHYKITVWSSPEMSVKQH